MQTLKYHTNQVNKIIELKNKSLVSCSLDKSIIFYNKDNCNNYIKDYKLDTNYNYSSVIQTKDNEICYSESLSTIYFYDIIQKKIIAKLNNINANDWSIDGFIMISDALLFIPSYNKISIININEYSIIRVIDIPNSSRTFGVCMINKNVLLTGDEKGVIRQWEIEGDNLNLKSIKENAHNKYICSLINIGDGHIASSSGDSFIKIW